MEKIMKVKSRGAAFMFEGFEVPASSAEEFAAVPKELQDGLMRMCRQSISGPILVVSPEAPAKAKPAPKAEKKAAAKKAAEE